ncbi:MAG TPA: hypothetical protein VG817_06040 [Gemmatimonadales bacterium]|nr:hypothetical protein [Gemmatimonadales bacterium]
MRMVACLLVLTPLSPAAAQLLAPRPVQVLFKGTFQEPDLTESSGAAVSSTFPRVLYTINDSGNPPEVFAFDSTGRPLGRWRVPGVRNRDWEALSRGPCPVGTCLFLGDIGDNWARQPTVVIYRVPEPKQFAVFRGAGDTRAAGLDSVVFSYPDGPHDAEAMWVDVNGDVLVVSKGREGAIRLYRVSARAFGGAPVTAELRQQLAITPDQKLGRMITDAALSPSGTTVALRTYTEIYLLPTAGPGRLGGPRASCNVAGLERQGEGIAWLDERRLLLTSEAVGGAGLIHIVTCGP